MPSGVYKHKKSQGFKNGNNVQSGRKWKIKDTLKMSLSKIGNTNGFKKGISSQPPGYKHSKETMKKISGENHWNWKDGISKFYSDKWSDNLRNSIRLRDNYICQECGTHQDEIDNGQLKQLDVHHIDYNKDNVNPDNLISLCRSCHVKTNYNRDKWTEYFNKLKINL